MKYLMNIVCSPTPVTLTPTVPTLMDPSTARVIRDTLEMVSRVLVGILHTLSFPLVQLNLSTTATLGTKESGCYGEVGLLYDNSFRECQVHAYLLSIQSYLMQRDKIHKKIELCLESKC